MEPLWAMLSIAVLASLMGVSAAVLFQRSSLAFLSGVPAVLAVLAGDHRVLYWVFVVAAAVLPFLVGALAGRGGGPAPSSQEHEDGRAGHDDGPRRELDRESNPFDAYDDGFPGPTKY